MSSGARRTAVWIRVPVRHGWRCTATPMVAFTHAYCGESYAVRVWPQTGDPEGRRESQSMIHPDDAIFEFSDYENAMESGIGATITDADGTEWTVYRVRKIDDLCIWRVYCSVAYCFQLLDKDRGAGAEKCDAAENCDPVFKMEKVVRKCRGRSCEQAESRHGIVPSR